MRPRSSPCDVASENTAGDVHLNASSRSGTSAVPGARGHPRAVDEHRRDLIQIVPRSREVTAVAGASDDPAHAGSRQSVTGLGEQLARGLRERHLGGELRGAPGEAGRDPARVLHAEELQQRSEPPAAAAPYLGEGELHAAEPGEQEPAAGSPTASPEPSPPSASGATERRGPTSVQRGTANTADVVEQILLEGFEQPCPHLRTEFALRRDR